MIGLSAIKYFFSREKKFISAIKNITGIYPHNIALYHLAFSHRSTAKEMTNGIKHSNERLEYLGDAVLGAVVADMLFKKFPFREEGFLTEMRSRIVSRDHLKQLAFKLGIEQFIRKNAGPDSYRSMHGDALEALIGAVYIDRGYNKAQHFILDRIIAHHVDLDEKESTDINFKSRLLNWGQKNKHTIFFETLEENTSNKLIKVRLLIDNVETSTGIDFIKKKAEQIAAQKACEQLKL